MENRQIRFFASAEEKASYIDPLVQDTNFEMTYPDSYIAVLINGNIFQFQDNSVANDAEGGKQAAMALSHAMASIVERVGLGTKVMPLIIRILGSPEWLSDAYLDAAVIPHRVNFGWFLEGFNAVESLIEFIAVEHGPSIPAYRSRGLHDHLKITLLDPHCKFIIYGDLLTSDTTNFLLANLPAIDHGRLMLLETSPGSPNPPSLLPTLQRFTLPTIFRTTPLRPLIIRPTPHIFRNTQHQRIDPPLHPLETTVVWIRSHKFCNDHYLRGRCPDQRCKSRHDKRLDVGELEALQFLARGLPCRHSNGCMDPECYAGHMCPMQSCRQERCKFYADMHVRDRQIVGHD